MARDIQVLLPTFNGARFIGEQLASLRAQTAAPRMKLLVRDDASTDGTPDLVRAFEPGDLLIEFVEGPHAGAVGSFLELLRAADPAAAVVMFCDQDDVWDPDKVEIAVQALEAVEPGVPALYCGRSVITDEGLRELGVIDDAPHGPSWRNALVQNIAPGHTMAMNAPLAALVARTLDPARAIMHDNWAYAVAAGLGRVVFDPVPHARYRHHAANELGYAGRRSLVQKLAWLVAFDRSVWTLEAQALWDAVGDRLAPARRDELAAFLDQATFGSRLRSLRRYPLVFQKPSTAFVNSVLYLLGRFRPR
jgi:glycosyltransferase involved in cell wall biosynthesis